MGGLVDIVRVISSIPGRTVAGLPVTRFPSAAELVRGHHSGVGINVVMVRELLLSHPGVRDAEFILLENAPGSARLTATVTVDGHVDPAELIETYTERQRWIDGSVVPDELHIVQAAIS